MAVPSFQELMLPLLRLAADGEEHSQIEAVESIANELNLATNRPAVGMKLLETFPEYLEFRAGKLVALKGEAKEADEETPEERLETRYQALREALAKELLERIKTAPPSFFEHVQATRWSSGVGRETVQSFVGSLEGHRARKGVLITTSWFGKDAHDYITEIEKKILLIDGQQLPEPMIERGDGVYEVATYTVRKLDEDYFESGSLGVPLVADGSLS